MGGPPDEGEEEQVTVNISGPKKGSTPAELAKYKEAFDKYKAGVKKVRAEFKLLEAKVYKVTYRKKDPKDSF